MKIRYTGNAAVRIIEPYVWNEENGYVQEIPEGELLENLLSYPKPDFEVVEDAPAVEPSEEAQKPAPAQDEEAEQTGRRRAAKE